MVKTYISFFDIACCHRMLLSVTVFEVNSPIPALYSGWQYIRYIPTHCPCSFQAIFFYGIGFSFTYTSGAFSDPLLYRSETNFYWSLQGTHLAIVVTQLACGNTKGITGLLVASVYIDASYTLMLYIGLSCDRIAYMVSCSIRETYNVPYIRSTHKYVYNY